MSNKTLTPRQRMINMMYLVLIAMLALNVSREILKSFHLFELSFISANKSVDVRNAETMEAFNDKLNNEKTRERSKQWVLLARKAHEISAEFNAYVEKMKSDIIKNGGGRIEAKPGETGMPELARPDDMEEHARYFMDKGLGNGRKLQTKINETRKELLELLKACRNGDQQIATLEKATQLKAEDPESSGLEKKTWVSAYLEGAPLAGVVTLLTKTQNDCKALEADVLTKLGENINLSSLVPNKQTAVIIPDSRYVMSGNNFRARIALATFDTFTSQRIIVNGQELRVKGGFGEYIIPASGSGDHKVEAKIESVDPSTGNTIYVNADPVEWSSFMPAATISADAMNVLFVGLENPMSISVPGITPENTIVSTTAGVTVSKSGNGKYVAKCSGSAKEATVTVSAKMPDGTIRKMGAMKYRIKRVPQPKLKLGTLNAGTYPKALIMAQSYVNATLEDFYFNGVRYTIRSYKGALLPRSGVVDEKDVTGNSAAGLRNLISKAKSGDNLIIVDAVADGPSGEVRLDPIILKFK